jgi:hypothetical protein
MMVLTVRKIKQPEPLQLLVFIFAIRHCCKSLLGEQCYENVVVWVVQPDL